MPEFIVYLEDPEFNDEPITSADVQNSLTYGGAGWRNVTVRKYDPESDKPMGTIPAIKRIRGLLDPCSLNNAKFLVDTARALGEAEWSTVKVEYVGEDGHNHLYRVIDNS